MNRTPKVLVVGAWNKSWRHESFIYRALRKMGFPVRGINTNPASVINNSSFFRRRRLEFLFSRFRPDIVIFSNGKGVNLETISEITEKSFTIMWYTDYRNPPLKDIVERAKRVKLFCITNRSQLDEYRGEGIKNVCFLPLACSSEFRTSQTTENSCKTEVAFLGSLYPSRERLSLLAEINNEFGFKIWGEVSYRETLRYAIGDFVEEDEWREYLRRLPEPLRSVKGEKYGKVVNNAQIIVGDSSSRRELYFSSRVWYVLGYGGFLLHSYVPCMEEIFENTRHLVWFNSRKEAMELIRYYLKKDEERERIKIQGYRYVHRHHTYQDRLRELFRYIGI